MGSWLLYFSLVCGLCTACHGLFGLCLAVISRLCSVIVAFTGHILYYCLFVIANMLTLYKHHLAELIRRNSHVSSVLYSGDSQASGTCITQECEF